MGIVADPKTVWEGLRIGELKAMLALRLGYKEAALENCEWVINFNQLPSDRSRLYRAISTILRTDLEADLSRDNFTNIWTAMFGKDMLERALNIVDAKVSFDGMPEDDLNLKGFKKHLSLLEAYEKLQVAKRKHYK